MAKRDNGLVDILMLILTIDKEKLPDKVMAAWYAMEATAYTPSLRGAVLNAIILVTSESGVDRR